MSVADGTYTVVGKTKHVTIRFRTEDWAGRRQVVSYLCGSDNERDFCGFAFVQSDGTLRVWRKFEGQLEHQVWSAKHLLSLDPEKLLNAGYEYALMSGRCSRCGRKLTVPASIHRGVGPECAKLRAA